VSVLCFVGLTLLFAAAAYLRAKYMDDGFNTFVLIAFALAAGLVIACVDTLATFSVCVVFACVCACGATDVSSGYVYDVVTYPSFGILLLASLYIGTLDSTVMWAGASFAAVMLLAAVTRRRGLGLGDVKLFTVVGAGLGQSFPEILGCSFVIGALVVGAGLVRRQIRFGQTVPFAPFIAVATIVCVAYERLFV